MDTLNSGGNSISGPFRNYCGGCFLKWAMRKCFGRFDLKGLITVQYRQNLMEELFDNFFRKIKFHTPSLGPMPSQNSVISKILFILPKNQVSLYTSS